MLFNICPLLLAHFGANSQNIDEQPIQAKHFEKPIEVSVL